MKSFIPWIGGKTLLAKKITAEFLQGSSSQDFGRYIEMFGGGASVLFSADKHAKFEVYNDVTGTLSICFDVSNITARSCRKRYVFILIPAKCLQISASDWTVPALPISSARRCFMCR